MTVFRVHLTLEQLAELFAIVKDSIAHTMFYSDLRAMGYAPAAAYTSALRQQIASFHQTRTPESHVRRTLMLMQAMLESDDPRLVVKLKQEVRTAGGSAAVTRAEKLATYIRANTPRTADDFVTLFVVITNDVLREHNIELQPLPLRWEQRGRLRDPIVEIRAVQL